MIARGSAIRRIVPVAVLIACWLAVFWPLLAGGRILYYGDIALYFVPELDFQRGALWDGRIPLWNPYLLCGVPFVGNPQAWPLYPSSLLLWVLEPERATGWIGALHCLVGAWGMRQFLSAQGRGVAAALLGAIVFGLGGASVSKLQFPNMVQAICWLPWLLLACDRAFARPGWGAVARLGGVFGLAVLAAHPQMTLLQFWLAVAWCAWRRPSRWVLWTLLAGAALGGLLAAGYLLPVVQAARESVRPELTLAKANRFILPPYAVPTAFIAPGFYGDPSSPTPFVARGNFWESCVYGGIVPFALALGALAWLRREAAVRFWGGVLVVAVWLAVGRTGGLFSLAFVALPGLSKFHDPARFLHLASFALAWLAARGADSALSTCRRPAVWAAALLGATALDLLPFSAHLNPTTDAGAFDRARRSLGVALSGGERVWHMDDEAVWRRYVDNQTYGTVDDPAEIAAFLGSGVPNLPLLVRVRDAGGYEPVRPAAYEPVRRELRERRWEGTAQRLLRLSKSGALLRGPAPVARPRAWLSAPGVSDEALPVTDTSESRVEVGLTGRAGTVTLVDDGAPGWSAAVDGTPVGWAPCANGARRCVRVPEGAKGLTFAYAPGAWRVGLFLSGIGACILLGILSGRATPVRDDRSGYGGSDH